LTLTPTLPSRPDPYDSANRPNFLSWGFQRPPLHRTESKSPTPGPELRCNARLPLRSFPSGMDCRPSRVPPSWFYTTSAVFPLRPCRSLSPCCRSWGSPRFPSSRNEGPRGALLPFEAFPPLTAFAPAHVRSGSSVGPIDGLFDRTIVRPTSVSVTALLALSPFPSVT